MDAHAQIGQFCLEGLIVLYILVEVYTGKLWSRRSPKGLDVLLRRDEPFAFWTVIVGQALIVIPNICFTLGANLAGEIFAGFLLLWVIAMLVDTVVKIARNMSKMRMRK